jgi:uncharacterized heparinase superfamily protein
MLPMLRLFRQGDGTLSHFNGMGITAADQLATLLTYDDMRSKPIQHAPHSGYVRLEAGRSLLVADIGRGPPTDLSCEAGASCLAFEFSSGRQRIIVNCGQPRTDSGPVALAARSTMAHSTASIGNASSSRFLAEQGLWFERRLARWLLGRIGPVALTGPAEVTTERAEREDGQALIARHDGFRTRFGRTHERRWRLSAEGQSLEGEDLFPRHPARTAPDAEAVIRFHLAPGIKASRVQGGRAVMLLLPNREAWQFEVSPGTATVEDSVFFSATDGARRTEQIVVTLKLPEAESVRWRFERLARPSEGAGRHAEAAPALL